MIEEENTNADRTSPIEDDPIARLLELTGPPIDPPPDVTRRVRDVARSAWRRRLELESGRRRTRARLALAAVLAMAAVGLFVVRNIGPAKPDSPATVERISGEVRLSAGGSRLDLAAITGQSFGTDALVATGEHGRIALRLATGASVRIDTATTLRLASPEHLVLETGGIYVDSAGGPPLSIHTPLGVARNMGTRFEVRLAGANLHARVRTGAIEVEAESGRFLARSGENLAISASGEVSRQPVSEFSPVWSWAQEITPPWALEGRTLGEWLDWVSSETGWQIRWVDDALRSASLSTVLHGSIEGFRPDHTPEAVLPTCGLTSTLDDGVLTILPEGA